jgi:hypothetical protein
VGSTGRLPWRAPVAACDRASRPHGELSTVTDGGTHRRRNIMYIGLGTLLLIIILIIIFA